MFVLGLSFWQLCYGIPYDGRGVGIIMGIPQFAHEIRLQTPSCKCLIGYIARKGLLCEEGYIHEILASLPTNNPGYINPAQLSNSSPSIYKKDISRKRSRPL